MILVKPITCKDTWLGYYDFEMIRFLLSQDISKHEMIVAKEERNNLHVVFYYMSIKYIV